MGINKKKLGFLASADLSDPDARIGRRKRARLRNEGQEAGEISAEKAPRSQKDWVDDARKATKLGTVGGAAATQPPSLVASKGADGEGDGAVGRKKQKRLAVLEAKKAKKAQKKMTGQRKEHDEAVQAVKGKAKDGKQSKAATELLQRCKESPGAQQRLLATCAERVSGAPEKELELFDVFFELHAKGADKQTRNFALVTALAVFRDLVPGYRIREPTEQEKQQVRSKPVLQLERYELGLLQKYRQLLPALEAAMKRDPAAFAPALGMMVTAASEFNYRQRLLATAVKYASSDIAPVRKIVAEALRNMIEADTRLEASREVVLAIGRIAQNAAQNASRGGGAFSLKHELVEVMLRIPLGKAEAIALHQGALDVDADEDTMKALGEASINQSADKVQKAESELLTEVFIVYLRILRQRQVHGRALLASALTGLSRWGHQVNIELLLEVLTELRGAVKDAMDRGDELVSLQGLNCALVLLSGPSQALVTDVTWLADALKVSLTLAVPSLFSTHSEASVWPPPLCFTLEEDEAGAAQRVKVVEKELRHALEADSVPGLVLRCLEAALKCPQAYGRASDNTLANLVFQLFVLAGVSDSHVGLAMLREGSLLLRKHIRLHTLLEIEGGLFGSGGITESSLTVVWQLQALAHSLVPEVLKAARTVRTAIPQRTRASAAISDLFPSRDGQTWLASEVARHLGAGLADKTLAPKDDGPAQRRRPKPAAFLSEDDLLAACDREHF